MKDNKDIRPLLVKFGVALAISFAGFLYSRLKSRNNKISKPPSSLSPRCSDRGSDVDGRAWCRDDVHNMKKTPSCGSITAISAERHEETFTVKVSVDNSMVGHSPSSRNSGDKDCYLLPEFNDLVKEFDFNTTSAGIPPKKDVDTPRSDAETPRTFRVMEKDDFEQQIRHLKNLVRMLQEKERNLEVQLLELYGLKEQETAVLELQNRLKINNMEAKLLTLKIESLQTDNCRLQAQVADHAKVVAELDTARAKIRLLKKKLRSEAEQNKEQIINLQKRVSRLQEKELEAATTDADLHLKLQRLRDLEVEAEGLRESNTRLHLENSDLARKFESTQILARSVLEDSETEELRELSNRLGEENESLSKEIERLQADRCTDVEELVYLRWINACLRYELRNFQPAEGKTVARDLSKSLSPESEEKVKQLILEYANTEGMGDKGMNMMDLDFDNWSTSQASCGADSGDYDDSPSSSKTHGLSKIKIFKKLRRLIRGKDSSHHHSRASPADKTFGTEDSDSLLASSSVSPAIDTLTDLQLNPVQTSSVNSSRHSSRHWSRHSMDIQRLRSPKMYDTEGSQRNSDVGFTFTYGRSSWGGESTSDLSVENRLDKDLYSSEKSDLVKFAEALKDSSGHRGGKRHRKSSSLSSF